MNRNLRTGILFSEAFMQSEGQGKPHRGKKRKEILMTVFGISAKSRNLPFEGNKTNLIVVLQNKSSPRRGGDC